MIFFPCLPIKLKKVKINLPNEIPKKRTGISWPEVLGVLFGLDVTSVKLLSGNRVLINGKLSGVILKSENRESVVTMTIKSSSGNVFSFQFGD